MRNSKAATEFLKECMADALLQYMAQIPYQKIRIDNIASAAGVNRSTWFRHFSSKNEALTFKLVRLWARWVEGCAPSQWDHICEQNLLQHYAFLYSNRQLVQTIYGAGLQTVIYDAFCQVAIAESGTSLANQYQISFYCYGLWGLLNEWVSRSFHEMPEEMAQQFLELVGQDSKRTAKNHIDKTI